jgi:SOS-response transcriptional repressor LexA
MLTPSQRRILKAIASERIRRGWPPSTRELMDATGENASRRIHSRLRALRAKGLVDWQDGQPGKRGPARTLHLTDAGWGLVL